MRRTLAPTLLALLAIAAPAAASTPLRLKTVAKGLSQPLALASPPGNRHDIYVGERRGMVKRFHDGRRAKRPLLDIRELVSSSKGYTENGLLGFAFAPDFRTSRLFYVSYSSRDATERLEEWRADASGTRAVASSRRLLLELPHPELHHYGGDLHFGRDRMLYMSVGDGGEGTGGARAQDVSSLYGKVIRIDPHASGGAPYGIPADNPFAATPGARPEIWLYGVRNPWRWSFDSKTGDMLLADVGEQTREEVNWLRAPAAGRGANLGWNCVEGSVPHAGCAAPGALAPAWEYKHFSAVHMPRVKPGRRVSPPPPGDTSSQPAGGCTGAVTGGYVVRDPQLAGLRGQYLFADYCSGGVWRARFGSPRLAVYGFRQLAAFDLAALGEDGCHRVYFVQQRQGRVLRLQHRRSRCVSTG